MSSPTDPERSSTSDGRGATRRGVLTALAATGGLATTMPSVRPSSPPSAPSSPSTQSSTTESPTLHVRVYPGPMPFLAWARYGFRGFDGGWSPAHRDALEAVRDAVDRLATYVEHNSGLDRVESLVERGPTVDAETLQRSFLALPDGGAGSWETTAESFRTWLHDRDEIGGSCCHLLLWWGPLDYDLGYGGTRRPNDHVGKVDGEGSQTIANVGATEVWDSRPVTRNIAIHETLHTLVSPDAVESVVGTSCDHALGSAVRDDSGALRVSPMATAYAGPERFGGGTQWHGTGCWDHDEFYRHDGNDGVDRWTYTTDLSDATLEAVSRYVERERELAERG